MSNINNKEQKPGTYHLSDNKFNLLVQGGAVLSVQPGPSQAGQRETQFVLPGRSFAGLELVWEKIGGIGRATLGPESNWQVEPPTYDNRSITYKAAAEAGELLVNVEWVLENESVFQKVTVKNTSNTELRLHDCGFCFSGNTEFKFGTPASDKVIGHHFISGHGSRLLFKRCDGQGPYLFILPTNGTQLEYFTQGRIDEGRPGDFTAYALSADIVKKAGESRMPVPGTSLLLQPGEATGFYFRWVWAEDNDNARHLFETYGLIDIDVAPGLTVPAGSIVTMSAKSCWKDMQLEFPEGAERITDDGRIYNFRLNRLGENELVFHYDGNKRRTVVTFFVTEDIETLIKKRGAFIASKQHTDPSLWYCGLLAEWNNETGALLGPDNYDKIGGWRIYEVSCDDPGLSKPAFLSGKLAEYPDAKQVAALDLYVEKFVWGGLQCTEDEQYPYALFGIPDWKKNRESEDEGVRGKLHIWRIYDYPHITLMYYNLYRIARDYPAMPLTHDTLTYLRRARDTAIAMFTVPMELVRWDARNTGLYNELCIENIIDALRTEGLAHNRLELHWQRKCRYFVMECTDLYGSEYPFDTTGFESTHALAKRALETAEDEVLENTREPQMTREQAVRFMETQIACNIATRGVLEPAYYWYGSDYRSNNTFYTLSYMSQMGGWSILDYALYYAGDPFKLLRLGYGSLLSSWALMNTGYWFPEPEHDGAACGGFEPMATGMTWLDQQHNGGPWYYSCEIDLGYCGALRGAATIVAFDPEFGPICYGGSIGNGKVSCEDGVRRRFHIITPESRLHILIDKGHFTGTFNIEDQSITFKIDPCGVAGNICLNVKSENMGKLRLNNKEIAENGELTLALPHDTGVLDVSLEYCRESCRFTVL